MDIDILRADELPCYGYFRNTTPNICSFAKKSVLFNDNYSTSPWTLPSIFSTITSLVPTFHHVRTGYINLLSPQIPTLAEVLRKEGYQTIFVGLPAPSLLSQENGGLRGYDKIISNQTVEQVISNLPKSSKPWFIHSYYSDLHLPYVLPDGIKPMEKLMPPPGLPVTKSDFDRLLNLYLKNHIFEVFQNTAIEEYRTTIFSPDTVNKTSLIQLFYDLSTKDPRKYLKSIYLPEFETYMQSFNQDNEAHVAYVRMLYDTKLNLLDKKFEALFRKLQSKPYSNNTITVIMSDHGESFGEHKIFGHPLSDHHSEVFHTPLIINSPGYFGIHAEQTTSNMDIFPTLLALIGDKSLLRLQGQVLIPYFENQNNTNRYIWSENEEGLILQNRQWLYYLPKGSTDINESILYDKIKDTHEMDNVASTFPSITKWAFEQVTLMDSYDAIYSQTKPVPDYNKLRLDPEKVKRLQKEGYF